MNAVLARLCATNAAAPQASSSADFVRPVRSLVARVLSADPASRPFELRDLAAVTERLLAQLASASQAAEDALMTVGGHAATWRGDGVGGERGYYSETLERVSDAASLRLWRKRKMVDEVVQTDSSYLSSLLTKDTTLRDLMLAISRRELKLRQIQASTARKMMALEDDLSRISRDSERAGIEGWRDTAQESREGPGGSPGDRAERLALARALEERLAALKAQVLGGTGGPLAAPFASSGRSPAAHE